MNIRFDLSHSTLTTEQQAVVDGVNKFLAWLPDNEDSAVARRLALGILEAADVAPQRELAEAAGFSQDRSVRVYKERLKEQGLAGLFDRPISGRPAITTQTPIEQAQRHLQRERAFNLDDTLKAWEQRYIEAAMRLTRGNVSQAAKMLGINRTTLYSRMEQQDKK